MVRHLARPVRPFRASLFVLIAAATPVAGQSPTDRATLEAFRDTLATVVSPDQLRPLEQSRPSRAVALIREGLIDTRRGELSGARTAYDEATRTLEDAVYKEDDWPYAWFALGLLRVSESRRGVVVKESRYLGQGASYRRGAMDAFARAIETDPAFVPAAEALAGLVTAMGHRLLSPDFLQPLQKASRSPGMPAVVWLALFRLEFGGRKYEAALNDLSTYLRFGGDTGTARVEQARTLTALGRTDEAVTAYLDGLGRAGDDGRSAYRADLAWIAADWELARFDSLPPTEVADWVHRFWRERDVLALRAQNDRLREHLRRWVYVHQNFLIRRPDDAPIHAEGLTGTDFYSTFDPPVVDEVLVEVEAGPPRFRAYVRTQWEIDDRGVIYLRHGEPVEKATFPGGAPNESWAYDLPEGRRIFHFLGSRALGTTAATTLVAALPLTPGMLDARGSLDSRYAGLAARIENYRAQARELNFRKGPVLRPPDLMAGAVGMDKDATGGARFSAAVLQREVTRNRNAIAAAVASDGFPQVFKKSLDAVVQVYGVGFGKGETRRILAVFAVPGRNLAPKPRPDGGPGVLYPISIRIIAMDREQGVIEELDTTRTFLSREALTGDQHLTGQLELAVPPGTYQVRSLVTAEGVDAASGAARDSVSIPDSPRDLIISDLILGREASGMTWSYRSLRVPLNPLDAYPLGSDANLFYELGGLTSGAAYTVTTSVRKADTDPADKPAVQSSFSLTATGPYQQVTRGIGLANLKPGAYALEVTVRETGTEREANRRRALNILAK